MNADRLSDEIISRRREDDDRGDELLVDHAVEVADRTVWLGRFETGTSQRANSGRNAEVSKGSKKSSEENKELFEADIARCVGWLHDFGKVAPAFQLYVRDEYPQNGRQRYTYHARLGAFAAYYALGKMGASERDRLAAWGAILRHHGRLPDFAEATFQAVNSEQNQEGHWAGPQIEQVQAYGPNRDVAATLLEKASGGTVSWDGFVDAFESGTLLEELRREVSTGPKALKPDSGQLPTDLYDRITRLWSSLTFADKTAAGEVERAKLEPRTLELDRLESHIESLQDDPDYEDEGDDNRDIDVGDIDPTDEASLNVLREAARQRVRANAPKLADSEVGTLTLPTGLGKTFTGITGAFELRDTLTDLHDRDTKPTVVYALPYTSIIEQTRDIFEDEDIFDADPRSNAFTVHHYLAETVTYTDAETDPESGNGEKDVNWSKAELLGESWRSGVVLTTFVQLFESLAGPTNGQGLKLPALHDAVIVLDEPQALSKHWWDAIRRLTRLLIDEYDARVISMTATQPTLFTEGDFDTRSLLASNADTSETAPSADIPGDGSSFERQASEAVARVRYDIHESVETATSNSGGTPLSHEAAASEIVDATGAFSGESADGRSVLAVCNTIGSSRELTDCIENEFLSNGHPATHVGETYKSVLRELDTNTDELPNHEALTARTLRELGFKRNIGSDEWHPTSDCSGKRYVATFNSRYRPLDRRVLIAVADILSTANVPFAFVSTQAIEAGVDISFARAYRDIAPLDSVVQTAGRCNRSFEWGPENGKVIVWMLAPVEDDESEDDAQDRKPPSKYVYDGNLLQDAAEILFDCRESEGATLSSVTLEHEAIPRYFKAIESHSLSTEKLVKCIDASNAEELGRRSLIEDGYETVDLLVAVTETDEQRLDDLGDAFQQHASEGFSQLADLAELRVSIPVRDLEESLPTHVPADRSARTDSDGIDVFVHYGKEGYGAYKLDGGGFVADDGGGPSSRIHR
ncbi:CRISPR-associated endonuclease Cas3'' [Halorussus sp. MSC15.2]|uniref:CRISPR-associated endonuclease Cas3'' n=1 Tax=Halorussus sp. MSC15.2 TaxID=2283638 RepID=UPI001F07ACAE|nr:CRISPR-associated endonuclease Cas3'' [Halorussus sp. MSC15.2]